MLCFAGVQIGRAMLSIACLLHLRLTVLTMLEAHKLQHTAWALLT